MKNNIETILEVFIKNEITATESRITAIRTFVDTLKSELMVYTQNMPTSPSEKEELASILKLFKSMITTYDEELQLLNRKREQMLEHLFGIRNVTSQLRTGKDSDIYIN